MTMPCFQKGKCAICHTQCEEVHLLSTNEFGGPDTDLRPAPMKRDSMCYWINVCNRCGYVAPSIFEAPSDPAVYEIIKTEAYKNTDNIVFKGVLSKLFYRRSMLVASDPLARYINLLYAAWDCDDAIDTENAVLMRKKALFSLNEVIEKKLYANNLSEEDAEQYLANLTLIKFDLLRRAGLFKEFEKEYTKLMQHPLASKTIMQVIHFLHDLNARKDTSCHQAHEAFQEATKK